jgi:hypothetical protein
MEIKEKINLVGSFFGIALSIFLISFVVFAVGEWTGPSATPPSENVSAPINTGSETQLKTGALGIGGVLETNTLKITGGTPGVGKVLTSDADGLASWTNNITTTEITTGTLKVTGGTPGVGKVLVSDAEGLVSWDTPAEPLTKSVTMYLCPTNGSTQCSRTCDGRVTNSSTCYSEFYSSQNGCINTVTYNCSIAGYLVN